MEQRNKILKGLKYLVLPNDEEYRVFNANVIWGREGAKKRLNKILGIRIPALRKYAKQIAKEKGEELIEIYRTISSNELYHEEKLLLGFVIGEIKTTFSKRLDYYKFLIPYIDNWAVCDCCVSTTKWFKKLDNTEIKKLYVFLQHYLLKGQEYDCRFAIIMYMVHFLTADYINMVLDSCKSGVKTFADKNIETPFYVEMGVAWCFTTALAKFPEETLTFLRKEKRIGNSPITIRIFKITAQKARDSFRVSQEVKKEITELATFS